MRNLNRSFTVGKEFRWRVRHRIIIPLALLGLGVMLGGCSAPGGASGAIGAVTLTANTTTLTVGQTEQLTADVSVTRGTPSTDVTWSSDNVAVASVDAAGLVQAHTAGTARITATSVFDTSKRGSLDLSVVVGAADISCTRTPAANVAHTLTCIAAGGLIEVRIPWQGVALSVSSRALDALTDLAAGDDFEPLGRYPLAVLAVTPVGNDTPVTTFNPPLRLAVGYDAATFTAAAPQVGSGELGLAVWNAANLAEPWTVLGSGVFHEGFWLADPRAGDGITLVPDPTPDPAQPRFQIIGNPTGGQAIAVISRARAELPLMWGSLPTDPGHELVEFDGGCTPIDNGQTLRCSSTAAGLVLEVPRQASGKVMPRVIALPMNREETLVSGPGDAAPTVNGGPRGELLRRVINFLVVDAADPTRVLTEFDPPMVFELAYTDADIRASVDGVLSVKYWDEYTEEWVILGYGDPSVCWQSNNGGCPFGVAVEAELFPEAPTFNEGFFVTGPNGGGIAKFTFNRWGDRLVAFGR